MQLFCMTARHAYAYTKDQRKQWDAVRGSMSDEVSCVFSLNHFKTVNSNCERRDFSWFSPVSPSNCRRLESCRIQLR